MTTAASTGRTQGGDGRNSADAIIDDRFGAVRHKRSALILRRKYYQVTYMVLEVTEGFERISQSLLSLKNA